MNLNKVYKVIDKEHISPLESSIIDTDKIILDRRKGIVNGLKTSLKRLDKVLGFWQFGNYYCVAGRPGSGKSTFLNQLILDFCTINKNKKIIVVYFNFEMAAYAQVTRLLSNRTKLSYNKILSTEEPLSDEELKIIKEEQEKLKSHNVLFINNALTPLTIEEVMYTIQEDNPDYKIVAVLDHSRLAIKSKGENENENINALSKVFMRTKKSLDSLNILVSQLNRNIESPDRMKDYFKPMLSDIFAADSIGQDIETALMLHRPETYDIEVVGTIPTKNKIFLEIPKNRNGAVGTVLLNHDLGNNLIMDFEKPNQEKQKNDEHGNKEN